MKTFAICHCKSAVTDPALTCSAGRSSMRRHCTYVSSK